MTVKLVEVTRNGLVDCTHWGHLVVADFDGNILYRLGDPDRLTFFRSSFKPLQAIAAIEKGIVEEYKLGLEEIALIVSSHSGEKRHIEILKSIMEKTGIEEEQLECGIHDPYGKEAAKELYMSGESATRLHCNCSGKHLGMMAAVKAMGLPVKGYSALDHQIQNDIDEIIKHFCAVEPGNAKRGIDGCGAPVYAIPLKNIARGYANLCNPDLMEGRYKKSQNYVISAMTMYPLLVAGKDRFDTILMERFGDRLISKMGAEGIYCAGLPGKGVGMAIKIEDGNSRATAPTALRLFEKMGVISRDEYESMEEFANPAIRNHRGEKAGEIRAVFEL